MVHLILLAACSESIKDNILFGSPFDRERYEATVKCCALESDLAIFEDGDETVRAQ